MDKLSVSLCDDIGSLLFLNLQEKVTMFRGEKSMILVGKRSPLFF